MTKAADESIFPKELAVTLIGMPGSGKSVVGRLLARALALDWTDTDQLVERQQRRSLATLLREQGPEKINALEIAAASLMDPRGQVVSTGGSMVYSEQAMTHLSACGPVVNLDVPLTILEERAGDLDARGVVRRPGQTLAELRHERAPLYQRWADVKVTNAASIEQTVREIVAALPGVIAARFQG